MTRRLHHPLWVHTPAVLLWLALLVRFWLAWPLPDVVPVHFGGNGRPDRWGSPLELAVVLASAGTLVLLLAFAFDELWARQERHKRFNWLSLFDEAFSPVVVLAAFEALRVAQMGGRAVYSYPWPAFVWLTLVSVAVAAVLEVWRPHRPLETVIAHEDTQALEDAIAAHRSTNARWAYWEAQNPHWVSWLCPAMAMVACLPFAIALMLPQPHAWSLWGWAVFCVGAAAAAYAFLHGGFRVGVTREQIVVRTGLLGVRLLDLRLADLASAEVHQFDPMKDFGGFGIRQSRQVRRAIYHSGNVGVLLTTTGGTKYLIGSDHPQRLAAAIGAARGL